MVSRWLCYCCALDYQATQDGVHWKELTVQPTWTNSSSSSSSENKHQQQS
jgi:hypothetical protein